MIDIKRILMCGVALGAMALLLSAGLSTEKRAEAAVTTFEVSLRGADEVPAVSSSGSAFARFTFDDATRELTYAFTVSGLSANLITAAHIHRGAVGVNGPAIYTLSTGGSSQIVEKITLTEADVVDLRAANLYVNVHSVDNPGGFARGQMILPAARAAAAPAAPAVRPPATGDAGLADSGTSLAGYGLLGLGIALLSGSALLLSLRRRA